MPCLGRFSGSATGALRGSANGSHPVVDSSRDSRAQATVIHLICIHPVMNRTSAIVLSIISMVLGALALLPSTALGASCADFPNQAAAQAAANTRDGDGDGIYCESLPCPCSTAAGGTPPATPTAPPATPGCAAPTSVQSLRFASAKYPNIRKHFLAAVRAGWPQILTINRAGADQRRDRLLRGVPTRAGYDRDEYPPATARGRGAKVEGQNPSGWMASIAYVRSSENRSHGATMGAALRKYCDGVTFRYVFS